MATHWWEQLLRVEETRPKAARSRLCGFLETVIGRQAFPVILIARSIPAARKRCQAQGERVRGGKASGERRGQLGLTGRGAAGIV